MFEFLVCQRWLAREPDRNWKLWMREDYAARDRMRNRLRERASALYAAADASLSAEQHEEAAVIADVRTRVAAELGDRQPEDRSGQEQKAALVGLGFVYDVLYRYGSSVAVHPTLLAVDLLYEKSSKASCFAASQRLNSGRRPSTCTARSSSTKLLATVRRIPGRLRELRIHRAVRLGPPADGTEPGLFIAMTGGVGSDFDSLMSLLQSALARSWRS